MQEVTYKGYFITLHCTGQWIATVWGPNTDITSGGQVVTATKEEGAEVLLSRVRARIDRQEANAKASFVEAFPGCLPRGPAL
jgi:hypothetical protein